MTFDHKGSSAVVVPPEIVSHRLYQAQTLASQAKASHEQITLKAKILKHKRDWKILSSNKNVEEAPN
jgi:hypothetical protein